MSSAERTPGRLSARRLGHPQLAFVRAWAEGVDLQQAAQRYLAPGAAVDARQARAQLQGLLDVLRSVARAHGRADLAALLRRDPASMVDAAAAVKVPSLDDFRAQQPEDFYSEAELLALYTAAHGAPEARSGTRRRQRLRARQLAALQWLEGVAVREPQPADALDQWLDERLATRLAAVGLTRLDQLQAWIRQRGFHWHRGIPRVGAAAAARVQHWLQQHARTLGALPPWAQRPPGRLDRAALMAYAAAAAPSAAVAADSAAGPLSGPPVPLERLTLMRLPASLSGREGSHRARLPPAHGSLAPDDDLAAMAAWLGRRTPGSATWRAYRKEAERLLLWSLWVAGKPVSSLEAADLPAYQAFLTAPPAGWTAPRGTPRWHEAWRPFEGPLSPRSAAMALGIVRGLVDAWVAQGYLSVNSWTVKARTVKPRTVEAPGTADRASAAHAADDDPARSDHHLLAAPARLRALAPSQQAAMARWLERRTAQQGQTPALLRLQALWAVACGTGLRPAELVKARLGWLQPPGADRLGDQRASWRLDVPPGATAGGARSVALSPSDADALLRYLAGREPAMGQPGQSGEPVPAHDAPLFAQLRCNAALSPARLYEVMAQAFRSCADDLAGRDPQAAATLRLASTHWLRHGFGLSTAAEGTSAAELQHRMGHRSRASSSVYRRALRSASLKQAAG